jgi:uncharacterized repeat protein (TIGR03803 family)
VPGAHAQTLTLLHSFSSFAPPPPTQGNSPAAALILTNDVLYGTTQYGGNAGSGTIFSVHADGSDFTTLYSFSATTPPPPPTNHDGATPAAALLVTSNAVYGTTESGGDHNSGTIFKANPDGTGVTTIYSFGVSTSGEPALTPAASLILSGNTLYGTAKNGGPSGSGTVFAIQTDGTGYTNLHGFNYQRDGGNPVSGLVLSGATLYGTTPYGGTNFGGTLFSINTNGSAFAILHNFANADGDNPMGTLLLAGNQLYGTTQDGGPTFDGVVFAINLDGSDYTNLYSFTYLNNDGNSSEAGLVLAGNTLYGTTSGGGSNFQGTVFALNTDGSNYRRLYSFTGGADGGRPVAPLFFTNNVLYGTTESGGLATNGTVFALSADGSSFTNLYSFTGGADGGAPLAGLAGDVLLGTASAGGTNGDGVLFSINLDGAGFVVRHIFQPPIILTTFPNDDGTNPVASLLLLGDTLYGTTEYGGTWGKGVIFAINTNGSGFTNLHDFSVEMDGENPKGNLILVNGVLYGTTIAGGNSYNSGTIFSLNPDGSDYHTVYNFTGGKGGAQPDAGLLLSGNTLYGTTQSVGSY